LPPLPGFPPRDLVGFAGRLVLVLTPPLPWFVVAVELENGAEVAMTVEEIVLLARAEVDPIIAEEVVLRSMDLMVLIKAADEDVSLTSEVAVAAKVEEVVLRDIVVMAPLPSSDLIPDAVVEAGGTTNPGPAATADAARA